MTTLDEAALRWAFGIGAVPLALGLAALRLGSSACAWLERIEGQWVILVQVGGVGDCYITDPRDVINLVPPRWREVVQRKYMPRAVEDCQRAGRRVARCDWLELTCDVRLTRQVFAVVQVATWHVGALGVHTVCTLYPEETMTDAD